MRRGQDLNAFMPGPPVANAPAPPPAIPDNELLGCIGGGDKRTQDRDIRLAKHYWRDYQQREAGDA
jgi:hypothetical protein